MKELKVEMDNLKQEIKDDFQKTLDANIAMIQTQVAQNLYTEIQGLDRIPSLVSEFQEFRTYFGDEKLKILKSFKQFSSEIDGLMATVECAQKRARRERSEA